MTSTKGIQTAVKMYFFLLFGYIFLGSQNLITLPTLVTDVLIFGFIIVSTAADNWKVRIRMDDGTQYSARHFMIPVIIIFIYSAINQIARGLSADYLKHTLTLCVRFIAYYLLGLRSARVFGKKTADYLLEVAVLSYIPAFVRHFSFYGFVEGVMVLLSPSIFGMQIELEVHTLTYIFGFLTLFYLYRFLTLKESGVKWRFIISAIMTFAGVKRIVLVALAIALLLMTALNFLKEKGRYIFMRIIALMLIVVSFIYLYTIHNGMLENVLNHFGISSSFRFSFWNYFRDRYSLNPWFLGYGISYAARAMQHEWQYIHDLGSVTNIHNDVLRIYLGLGFVGSLLYWFNFFYASMRRIKRVCSVNAAMFSLVVSTYYFLTSMVANEGINALTNGIYFLIIYLGCFTLANVTDKGKAQ